MNVHPVTIVKTPISFIVQCRCGWSRTITRKQNALARAAKVRAAVAEHGRETMSPVTINRTEIDSKPKRRKP